MTPTYPNPTLKEITDFWCSGWARLAEKYAYDPINHLEQWGRAKTRRDQAMNRWREMPDIDCQPAQTQLVEAAQRMLGDSIVCQPSYNQREIQFSLPAGQKEATLYQIRLCKRVVKRVKACLYRAYSHLPEVPTDAYLGQLGHTQPFSAEELQAILQGWFTGLKVSVPLTHGYNSRASGVYLSPTDDVPELQAIYQAYSQFSNSSGYITLFNHRDQLQLSFSSTPEGRYHPSNLSYPVPLPLTKTGFLGVLHQAFLQTIPYRRAQHPLPEGLVPPHFTSDRHPDTAMYHYYSSFYEFKGRDILTYNEDLAKAYHVGDEFIARYPQGHYIVKDDPKSIGITLYDKPPHTLATFKATVASVFPKIPVSSWEGISGTHNALLISGSRIHPKLSKEKVGLLQFTDSTRVQVVITRSIFTISTGPGSTILLADAPLTIEAFTQAALNVLHQRR